MLRPYTPADQEAVIQLLRLNTPTFFGRSEEKDLLHYLAHEREDYFVVEEGGSVIGCCGINSMPDTGQVCLSWDIIHPDHHRKGVGSMFTNYRIEKIREMPGIHSIIVRTSQLTHHFYEKFGFRLVKVKKDYWSEGLDLYHMELRLA